MVHSNTNIQRDVTPVTEKDIEEGLSILAWLIDRHGDAAWPLFERLEKELESRKHRKARIRSRLTDKFG